MFVRFYTPEPGGAIPAEPSAWPLRHGAAGARPSVEQNPHYVAPNESARAERDAEGDGASSRACGRQGMGKRETERTKLIVVQP